MVQMQTILTVLSKQDRMFRHIKTEKLFQLLSVFIHFRCCCTLASPSVTTEQISNENSATWLQITCNNSACWCWDLNLLMGDKHSKHKSKLQSCLWFQQPHHSSSCAGLQNDMGNVTKIVTEILKTEQFQNTTAESCESWTPTLCQGL